MELPNTSNEFLEKYWLKDDLIKICEENSLPKNGSKQDLLGYIACFIDKKPVIKKESKREHKSTIQDITIDMTIDMYYSNDENHRRFFIIP